MLFELAHLSKLHIAAMPQALDKVLPANELAGHRAVAQAVTLLKFINKPNDVGYVLVGGRGGIDIGHAL